MPNWHSPSEGQSASIRIGCANALNVRLDWLFEMAQARKIDLARLSIVAFQLGLPLLPAAPFRERIGYRKGIHSSRA
jgi:hypothetical protein